MWGLPREAQIHVQSGLSPRLPNEAAVLAACCRSLSGPPWPVLSALTCSPRTTDPNSFPETEGTPTPQDQGGLFLSRSPTQKSDHHETIASPMVSSPLPASPEPPPYTHPWAGPVGSAFRIHLNGTPPHHFSATATHPCPPPWPPTSLALSLTPSVHSPHHGQRDL